MSRIEVFTALLTASTLWVIRTAPIGRLRSRIGTAVARISSPRVSLSRVICSPLPLQRRFDLGTVVVAAARRRPGRVGEQAAAASTTITRPRTLSAERSAIRCSGSGCGGSTNSVALVATTSAWLRAWPLTSESTRSRRLSASGTPKAISASSRT